MGAKFSKGGKVKQNGTDATHDESLDTFNKTSTLPASFRKKDDEVTKTGTLPRGGVDLDRNKSFSKRFRKSITKLVGQNEVTEETSESQVPTEPSSVVLGQDECKENLKDVAEEEVYSKADTPNKELDLKSAQKVARAQFFQDLYNSKEQAHIPKPPRSRNIPSPVGQVQVEQDADITIPATFGTPVVKLIKKHEGEIEKQQELIGTNNSVNFPENENKDAESPMKAADVYSEPMIKDDFVCASEKQVEEVKQEEVSAVREETILKDENISVTKSMSFAASNVVNVTEEKSIAILEEKMLSVENVEETQKEEISVVKEEIYSREETIMKNETSTISDFNDMKTEEAVAMEENMSTLTNDMQVEEIKQEGVSVVKEDNYSREETIMNIETSTISASNDMKTEEAAVTIEENMSTLTNDMQVEEIKQEGVSVVKEDNYSREETIMKKETSTISDFNDMKTEEAVAMEENMSTLTNDMQVEEIKQEGVSVVKEDNYSREETIMNKETSTISASNDMKTEEAAVTIEENMSTLTNAMQVVEIKQEGVLVEKEETSLTEETILKEETLVTESMNLTAKKDIQIETDEDNNTSYETEDMKSDTQVNNTKEPSETLDEEKLEIDAGMEFNESDITEVKEPQVHIESLINSSEYETIEDPTIVGETEQKDGEEPEMTKDNGALALHDSENKAITIQEKEENMIDPNNAQQDIRDDNFTEPNSLESINQNDEINQSVTENKDVESTVTGESDLVKETVILDNDVKGPFDLRSEGGSEGGVSTDEGIVASDDEENKSELHKVDNLEAKVHKSAENLNDDAEPEKEL